MFFFIVCQGEFAYDTETMWSAHPTYGLWFVFRAVVVFDIAFVGPDPPYPVSVLTTEEKDNIKKLTLQAVEEGWRNPATLLAIRNTCAVGKEGGWNYEGDMLKYFYPIGTSRQDVIDHLLKEE